MVHGTSQIGCVGLFASAATDPNLRPYGAVLCVHDSADSTGVNPDLYFRDNEGVTESRVVVLELGLGHGLLYTPHHAWVGEVVDWSGIEN